jgi:hypothetical protein
MRATNHALTAARSQRCAGPTTHLLGSWLVRSDMAQPARQKKQTVVRERLCVQLPAAWTHRIRSAVLSLRGGQGAGAAATSRCVQELFGLVDELVWNTNVVWE